MKLLFYDAVERFQDARYRCDREEMQRAIDEVKRVLADLEERLRLVDAGEFTEVTPQSVMRDILEVRGALLEMNAKLKECPVPKLD